MTTGRQKCDLLRSIRQQLAIEYGLDYTPAECHHVGDCPGTCLCVMPSLPIFSDSSTSVVSPKLRRK